MKRAFLISMLALGIIPFFETINGQSIISIHESQNKAFRDVAPFATEQQWDSINQYHPQKRTKNVAQCKLKKVVFGWHPYWSGTYYNDYDFSMLTDIAYFSYEVDPTTGNYSTIHSWKTTTLFDLAKAAGTRVSLAVTLFSGHGTFFGNPLSCQTLIDSLISLVKLKDAQGVNIDFEAVPASQRNNLTNFMKDLGTRFHMAIPGSVVSIALPSVDWRNAFDVMNMLPYVDLFIIMGYDYYYGGSAHAGPVSPKNSGALWSPYDVTRSVRNYLQIGVPAGKLCLGVPYYGYDWPTSDNSINASTTGTGTAVLYKNAVATALDQGRFWDRNASVPYYTYTSGTNWRQCWYDDETSLGFKYDMVNMYNIGGIGIWALGYDRTRPELWNLLKEKFSSCGNTNCSGYFTDMGGPEGNYFSGDDYTFTLSQNSVSKISTSFTDFNLTTSDTLFVFQGASVNSPVIGKYSGQENPGTITSDTNAITFRFVSQSQAKSGWQAFWTCGSVLTSVVLNLSGDTISENRPIGSLIGRFKGSDGSLKGYQLFGNDNDNMYFKISGDSLVSSRVFNYDKQKTLRITVQGEDLMHYSVFSSFDIKIINSIANSIQSHESGTSVLVLFPNPAVNIVHVSLPSGIRATYIEVFDFKGGRVCKSDVKFDIFDGTFLSNGLYILKIHTNTTVYICKLLIIR